MDVLCNYFLILFPVDGIMVVPFILNVGNKIRTRQWLGVLKTLASLPCLKSVHNDVRL